LVCAKPTITKFHQMKVVLLIKFMSLGCIIVTLRSKTLLYIKTSYSIPYEWSIKLMFFFLCISSCVRQAHIMYHLAVCSPLLFEWLTIYDVERENFAGSMVLPLFTIENALTQKIRVDLKELRWSYIVRVLLLF